MFKLALLVTAAPLLLGFACDVPRPEPEPKSQTDVDLAAERAALSEAADRYNQAAQSLDVDAVATLYAADAMVLAPNMATMKGTAGVREFLTAFTSTPGFQVSLETPTVVVSKGGDLAYTYGEVGITMDGTDGKPVTSRERDFHLWKKQPDGSWKILIDIWNSPGSAGQ